MTINSLSLTKVNLLNYKLTGSSVFHTTIGIVSNFYPTDTLLDKNQFLHTLSLSIKEWDDRSENIKHRNTTGAIVTIFSNLFTLSIISSIPFPFNIIILVTGLTSGVTGIFSSVFQTFSSKGVRESLKKHQLALNSEEFLDWACIWELLVGSFGEEKGTKEFCEVLYQATLGEISRNPDGRECLILDGLLSPFTVAVTYISKKEAVSIETVVDNLKNIKKGGAVKTLRKSQSNPILEEYKNEFLEVPVIGANTRLNAIDIKVTEVNHLEEEVVPQPVPQPVPQSLEQNITSDVWVEESQLELLEPLGDDFIEDIQNKDVVDAILEQGLSLVFLGGQGVGKSNLMSIASQEGVLRGKFKKVSIISGLSKSDEDSEYWKHCDNALFVDTALLDSNGKKEFYKKTLNIIRDFKKATIENPELLILDEIAYLASRLYQGNFKKEDIEYILRDEIVELLIVVGSGGSKRGWEVWLGSPQGAIGDMNEIGRKMKQLKPVLCAVAPDSKVISRGSYITWDEGLFRSSNKNFPELIEPNVIETGRIVFFSKAWYGYTKFERQEVVKEVLEENIENLFTVECFKRWVVKTGCNIASDKGYILAEDIRDKYLKDRSLTKNEFIELLTSLKNVGYGRLLKDPYRWEHESIIGVRFEDIFE